MTALEVKNMTNLMDDPVINIQYFLFFLFIHIFIQPNFVGSGWSHT